MSLDTLFKTGMPLEEARWKDGPPTSPFVVFCEQVLTPSLVADNAPDSEYTD